MNQASIARDGMDVWWKFLRSGYSERMIPEVRPTFNIYSRPKQVRFKHFNLSCANLTSAQCSRGFCARAKNGPFSIL
jgi:hypothetical protein